MISCIPSANIRKKTYIKEDYLTHKELFHIFLITFAFEKTSTHDD